jgi:hypothetical protein
MLTGHLRSFAFPVGARRALDFADFFRARSPELAALKTEQATQFGRAQTLFAQDDLPGTGDTLTELAAAEDRIRALIVDAPATC